MWPQVSPYIGYNKTGGLMSPVDDYFDEKEKLADLRHEEDTQTYLQWKENPTNENLEQLYNRFDTDFNRKIREWSGGAKKVNQVVLKVDLQKNALKAFETWDPSKAKLRTHVNNMMRHSQRHIGLYQNMAFIPEEKRALIGPIDNARDTLSEQGVAPTHQEIASYLNSNPDMLPKRVQGRVTPKLINTIDKFRIRDIPAGMFETDPAKTAILPGREVAQMLHVALDPQERDFYGYMMGMDGKPKIDRIGEIGKRMGLSPTQSSRLHRKIIGKYEKYS